MPGDSPTRTAALLLLADGRLPAGGYAHSAGLEQAIARGWVRTAEDIAEFLRGRIHTTGLVAAAFAAAAQHRTAAAIEAGDLSGLRDDHVIQAELAGDARLLFREELVLGQHAEDPGTLSTTLDVRRDGAPAVVQRIALGPEAVGSRSQAVLGAHRAVGNVVVVEPNGAPDPESATPEAGCAVMRQDEATVQITALGTDAPELRRRLDRATDLLGDPWASPTPRVWSAIPR